jgi:uncharacterized protein YukE
MAIELPSEVAWFLNFIGVPWININEDKVREFATHVRTFGSSVQDAHQNASSTLQQMGASYSGSSYEALMSMWGSKSTQHMTELIDGCNVLATALDGGADFIEGQKIACIAELAVMAASFVADQAAAVVTFGASEALMPVIIEGAEKLMDFAVQQVEQYVIGQILNAALKPLIDKMGSAVQGLVLDTESAVLGVGGGGSAGDAFNVDPDAIEGHAGVIQGHAQTMSAQVSTFSSNLRGLSFQ